MRTPLTVKERREIAEWLDGLVRVINHKCGHMLKPTEEDRITALRS
jgi:hypothetical protein